MAQDAGDLLVQGTLDVRGPMFVTGVAFRPLAAAFFIADPGLGGPVFASNNGFSGFVANGVGDYTLTLTTDPGVLVAGATAYLATDGVPGVVTIIPLPGGAQILLTHLDGTPVDTACMLSLWFNG